MRSHRGGRSQQLAYLDDHAFLIHGLLELFQYDADPQWLSWALELQAALDARFEDDARGGYFYTSDEHEVLLYRQKPSYDGAEPSGNSVAAENLLRLALLTGDHAYRERAERLFMAFSSELTGRSMGHTRMLSALDAARSTGREVIVVSPGGREVARPLLDVLAGQLMPSDVQLTLDEARVEALAQLAPTVANKVAIGGAATAYVCDAAGRCDRPTADPDVLRQQLSRPLVDASPSEK